MTRSLKLLKRINTYTLRMTYERKVNRYGHPEVWAEYNTARNFLWALLTDTHLEDIEAEMEQHEIQHYMLARDQQHANEKRKVPASPQKVTIEVTTEEAHYLKYHVHPETGGIMYFRGNAHNVDSILKKVKEQLNATHKSDTE